MGVFDGLIDKIGGIFKPTPGNQVQKTTTTLGPEAQSFWNNLFPQIQNQGQAPIWQGQTVQGFGPDQLAGMAQIRGAANGSMQDLANSGVDMQKYFLNQQRLDPTNDPLIQRQAAAATAAGTLSAQDSLRNVRGQRAGSGLFGSNSRDDLREGAAYGNLAAGNEQTVANIFGNAYQNAANRAMQAQGMNSQVMQNSAVPGTVLAGVGEYDQAQRQKELDAQIQAYYQPYLMQQAQIANMLQQLGLMPGSTTTSTATGTPAQSPLALQLISAGAGALKNMK